MFYNAGVAEADPLPAKKDVARALLLKGTVFIHLDPRAEDVVVPTWLKAQPQLVLQVGLDKPVPVPDLRVDDAGVCGTLSFNRSPFTCTVPWRSVFAVVGDDGRGMLWPASMPEEIAAEVAREARRAGFGEIQELESSVRGPGGGLSRETVGREFRRQPPTRLGERESDVSRRVRDRRPALSVIKGERAAPRSGVPRAAGRRARPAHLRLVK